jgi:hypothetical protein
MLYTFLSGLGNPGHEGLVAEVLSQEVAGMNDIRKGQIAVLFVKERLRKKGVRLTLNLRREIGNEAKNLGISLEEATEFFEDIVRELVEEAFAKKRG